MVRRLSFALLVPPALLTACAPEEDLATVDAALVDAGDDAWLARTAAEDAAIVQLANTASVTELDVNAGLDSRAANGIVDRRNGTDNVDGTSDDRRFVTVAEVDAVAYVGTSALDAMVDYAEVIGLLAPVSPTPAPSCLVISEVIEGWGNYNKAFEVWNCGSAPVALGQHGACLVRNGDTACTTSVKLANVTLAPGDTHVVCRTRTGTFNDPIQTIRAACDQEASAVTTFDGDDRLLVFRDNNGNGTFQDGTDTALDTLGRFGYKPPTGTWADTDLRRCNLAAYDGVHGTWYDDRTYFSRHTRGDGSHLGVAPTQGCP